jgi:hypothetical protein
MLQVGKKRVLHVTASVSTHRPDVSWCQSPFDKPPENRPVQPDSLGPFALSRLDVSLYNCELRKVEHAPSVVRRSSPRRLAVSSHVASSHPGSAAAEHAAKVRSHCAVDGNTRSASLTSLRQSWLRAALAAQTRRVVRHVWQVRERAVWMIEGMRLSPITDVSLEPGERDAALIPTEATHYAFGPSHASRPARHEAPLHIHFAESAFAFGRHRAQRTRLTTTTSSCRLRTSSSPRCARSLPSAASSTSVRAIRRRRSSCSASTYSRAQTAVGSPSTAPSPSTPTTCRAHSSSAPQRASGTSSHCPCS